MRKNGFTLIELLAAIVILAIIALIATPIILGIINDARDKANERSVELYASAVRNAIGAYQLTSLNSPKTFSNLNIQYSGDVKCTVQELYEDGSFYLEGCKVNNSEKEYSYGTKKEGSLEKTCTIERQVEGKYSIGDIVSCKTSISTEQFMVMENEDEDTTPGIDMFAKYNLEVGYETDEDCQHSPIVNPTGIQNSNATGWVEDDKSCGLYGIIEFASENYWYDYNTSSSTIDSNYEEEGRMAPYVYGNYSKNSIYPHVQEYLNILNIDGATGRLLSKEEAEHLRNNTTFKNWLDLTGFWLGTAFTDYEAYMFAYGTKTVHFFTVSPFWPNYWGVRPVITIPISEIQ